MKLIIDISEEEYKRMTEESIFSTHTMICAIQNGTPLDSVKAEINQLPLVLLVGYDHIEKDSVLQVLDNIGRK